MVHVQVIERAEWGQFTDVKIALPARLNAHGTGAQQTGPLSLEMPAVVEYLHAVVFAIRNIDPTVPITADVMGKVELTGLKPALNPGVQMSPGSGKHLNVSVAVTVADVNISIGCERGVRAAIVEYRS